jgi:hypothetical protein
VYNHFFAAGVGPTQADFLYVQSASSLARADSSIRNPAANMPREPA